MKFLKPRTFIIFALAGLSGAVLLHTSQNVQQAEERLEALEVSKTHEEEKIRMLRAEWETLNRPERLEKLAHEFLDLVPPAPEQMTGGQVDLPEADTIEYDEEESFEPVLQPVTYEEKTAPVASAAVPVPKTKPAYKPAQSETVPQKQPVKEKDFGSLLDELGGAP